MEPSVADEPLQSTVITAPGRRRFQTKLRVEIVEVNPNEEPRSVAFAEPSSGLEPPTPSL